MKKEEPKTAKKNIGVTEEPKVFMFFSKKSSNQFGHNVAYVLDSSSGRRKKVKYTATSSDIKASEYKWPDKELIWSGNLSDYQFIGTEKPNSYNHIDILKY